MGKKPITGVSFSPLMSLLLTWNDLVWCFNISYVEIDWQCQIALLTAVLAGAMIKKWIANYASHYTRIQWNHVQLHYS